MDRVIIELIWNYDKITTKITGSKGEASGKHPGSKHTAFEGKTGGRFRACNGWLHGREKGRGDKKRGCIEMPSYSSVCFATTSPILGEELEYQTF